MNNKKNQLANAVILSTISTVVFVTVVTIVGDLYHPLKDWLKEVFTHHWIGKGVLGALIYVALTGIIMYMPFTGDKEALQQRVKWLVIVATICVAVLFLFFIYEAFYK